MSKYKCHKTISKQTCMHVLILSTNNSPSRHYFWSSSTNKTTRYFSSKRINTGRKQIMNQIGVISRAAQEITNQVGVIYCAVQELTNLAGVISRAARWLENNLFLIRTGKYKQETTQQLRIYCKQLACARRRHENICKSPFMHAQQRNRLCMTKIVYTLLYIECVNKMLQTTKWCFIVIKKIHEHARMHA